MPYHTNEELGLRIVELADTAGERASLHELGQTVEGRPITAVTVAGPDRKPDLSRPQALVTANIHGNEVISSEVALALIELLCTCANDPCEEARGLLDSSDVTVVPAINLDARERTITALGGGGEGGERFRLLCKAPRGNMKGVDLNRNFPYPEGIRDVWYPLSGTTISWLPWYRGPEQLSEPETRAIAELAEDRSFKAAINLHSVSRFFLYPYCYSHKEPADLAAFLAMGEAFRAAQPDHPYRVRQSRSWYAILGDLDDWLYDRFGTLSVTVELSTPLSGVRYNPLLLLCSFLWMNPRMPELTIANTTKACCAALRVGVRRYLLSHKHTIVATGSTSTSRTIGRARMAPEYTTSHDKERV